MKSNSDRFGKGASEPLIPAEPFNHFDRFELEEMVELVQGPAKAIHKCISKGQLRTLCMHLLAQNIALQARIVQLETKGASSETI